MIQRQCRFVVTCLLIALPVTATADYLGGVRYSQSNPATLPYNEYVDVSIDYKITAPGGGIIYARPYTNGAPTPSYAASGGNLVAMGTGTAVQFFRITSGEHVVDQVCVFLTSPDQSQTWLEVFLPVYFAYGPNAVYNMNWTHARHSVLKHGQQYSVTFNYRAADPAGCRVYVRPYTNGALTPGYSASGSALLPQTGTTTQWFTFAGDADVTHLHYTVYDHNNVLLFEHDIPYPLHWRSIGLNNIAFDRPYEASLHNTQNVTATFTLDHDVPGGVRVWAHPTIGGMNAPAFTYQPSGLEAVGAHLVSRWLRIHEGEQQIDGIRFHVTTESGPLLSHIVPVDYHWAAHAVQYPVFTPKAPAILSNSENLTMTFDYLTSSAGNVLIFPRPAHDGNLVVGYSAAGSPNYAPPSGSGTSWVTYHSGDHLADSMRFLMTNNDQTQNLLTHFYHGHWVWGSSAVITPVPQAGVVAAAQLGATYPNPFNPVATIPLILADDAAVRLAVFDLRGRLVQTLVDGPLPAGRHDVRFDGRDLPSGTYLCRLDGPGGRQTRRMTLLK